MLTRARARARKGAGRLGRAWVFFLFLLAAAGDGAAVFFKLPRAHRGSLPFCPRSRAWQCQLATLRPDVRPRLEKSEKARAPQQREEATWPRAAGAGVCFEGPPFATRPRLPASHFTTHDASASQQARIEQVNRGNPGPRGRAQQQSHPL